MSIYFLDSSSLVKRYVAEIGTDWLQTLASPLSSHRLIIARITWVEVLSALARRQREGSLSSTDLTRIAQTFRYDLDMQYQVVELEHPVIELAGQLVRKHPLRAYDAIQLAAALRVRSMLIPMKISPLVFLAADKQLLIAAQAEGLVTDNPNHHP